MPMNRAIAFLRAINVGGHTVKMEVLRGLFEQLGFQRVSSFIASGNLLFDTAEEIGEPLEQRIEDHLAQVLGYEVVTFLRNPAQVKEIAQRQLFPELLTQSAGALNVGFLKGPLEAGELEILNQLETPIDHLASAGAEVYWLCQVKQSESQLSNVLIERKLRRKMTLRGIKTIKNLAELVG